jgi:hypothetical protein
VIDERPIRDAAFKAYQKAEKQVATAREEIEAFETRDLPAFSRWEAQVFGPLMTELREVASALEEKNHLLALIDEERFWTNCSRIVAYRRVMEARNNPSPPPTKPEFDSSSASNQAIPKVFGERDLPPDFDIDEFDRMSSRQRKDICEFYEDAALMFELLYGVEAPQFDDLLEQERNRRPGRKAEEPPLEHHFPHAPQPPPSRDWDRIKELYRTLVRRLHPDTGGAQTARERDLWQQVQDAYKARDLEWLEAISGRLDAAHQNGASLSIQILRRMTADLRNALHGLRSQLSKHRRHPAWKFHETTKALAKFEAKRRRALEHELRYHRQQLREIERILNDLAERASRPAKSKKKATAPAAPKPEQEFFPF